MPSLVAVLLVSATAVAAKSKIRTLPVRAYCPCKRCCGAKAKQLTRTGRSARLPGIASNRLPFGTWVYIPKIGWRVVDDTGPNVVELRLRHHHDAKRWGVKKLRVIIRYPRK